MKNDTQNNVTLIITCDNEHINDININYFKTIFFDVILYTEKNNECLNEIVSNIETEYFSIADIYDIVFYQKIESELQYLKSLHKYTKYEYFNKQDIVLITLCYNEIQILPFAVQYWKRLCNKVIVYDNGSTDGSLEYLLQDEFHNFIEVRNFRYSDNNKINDDELSNFKNNIWKEFRNTKYKWAIVCDVDELFYIKDFSNFLRKINDNNIDVIKCKGYQLVCAKFPQYHSSSLFHHLVKFGIKDSKFNKCLMFNLQTIYEMNYDNGAHLCHPVCNNYKDIVIYQYDDVRLYHAKYITFDYIKNKYKSLSKKLSQNNIEHGYGREYNFDEQKLYDNYINMIDNCEFIDDWFDDEKIIDKNIIDTYQEIIQPTKNNNCCIVIPIYKEHLNKKERISLLQLFNIMGKKYDIICIYPNSLINENYMQMSNYINFVPLNDEWFESIYTYNQLCLNWKFYKIFSNYKYMLLYQLDSYINYDNLDYFISLDYNFIGAPHYAPHLICGNGGFSLRKIESMINILKNCNIDYNIYEDIFINSKIINKTPINICRFFAICDEQEVQENILTHKPMGYHYF